MGSREAKSRRWAYAKDEERVSVYGIMSAYTTDRRAQGQPVADCGHIRSDMVVADTFPAGRSPHHRPVRV